MSSPTRSINYALNYSKAVHCWCGAVKIEPPAQQQQLTSWQEQGHDIFPLGI